MNSTSIHSPANSLVQSSSFHSKDSLSPPSTPGNKRLCYPDQLSPMPEFLSSNGSLLSVEPLFVKVDVILEEEQAVQEAKQMERIGRPMPSFVLQPKPSTSKMNMNLELDQLEQIELPYSEPSPAPPTHQRLAFASSLPRLPSLSEHNDVRSSAANTFMLKPEHIQNEMIVDDDDDKKNSKLRAFQRKDVREGIERNHQSKKVKRSSLVARCA